MGDVIASQSAAALALMAARGIRFIFATGYGEGILPHSLQGGPMLQKPFEQETLERSLRRAVAQGRMPPT